jgi:hypothetical protein
MSTHTCHVLIFINVFAFITSAGAVPNNPAVNALKPSYPHHADVKFTYRAQSSQVFREQLSQFVSKAISQFDCTVSAESDNKDAVLSIYAMAGQVDAKPPESIHLDIRCSTREAAAVLQRSNVKTTISSWLNMHGWEREHEQHVTDFIPWDKIAFIQEQLLAAGSGGGGNGVIIGVSAAVAVLGAISGFVVFKMVKQPRPSKLRASSPSDKKEQRQKQGNLRSPTERRSKKGSEFRWKSEWGAPPLYIVQENPDVDWSQYVEHRSAPLAKESTIPEV